MTEQDVTTLELATAIYRDESARIRDVRERLGLGATRFWQRVNHLIDTREALELDPIGVNRLRRMRESRTRSRSGRPARA